MKYMMYFLCGGIMVSAYLGAAQDGSFPEVSGALMKAGAEQVPVALTPMTLFPWMPISAEYVGERLVPFLSAEEKELFDKTLGILSSPVRASLYQGVVDTYGVLVKTVGSLKVSKSDRKKRAIALTALRSLRSDVARSIVVLNKRQRLFLQGKDAFASIDYRKARVEREKSFSAAAKSMVVAATLAGLTTVIASVFMAIKSQQAYERNYLLREQIQEMRPLRQARS